MRDAIHNEIRDIEEILRGISPALSTYKKLEERKQCLEDELEKLND